MFIPALVGTKSRIPRLPAHIPMTSDAEISEAQRLHAGYSAFQKLVF